MADFDQFLGEDSGNARMLDLVRGFCGDECAEDEFVVIGTGQVLDVKRMGNPETQNPIHTSSELNEGFGPLHLGAMYLCAVGAVAILALKYILHLNESKLKKNESITTVPRGGSKSSNKTDLESEKKTEHGPVSPATPVSEEFLFSEEKEPPLIEECDSPVREKILEGCDSPEREPTLVDEDDIPEITLPNSSGNLAQNIEISTKSESQARTVVSCGSQNELGKKENPPDSLVPQFPTDTQSSLSLLTENELKQHVGEMARITALLRTEFEKQGHTLSQSEALILANQRLLSVEALRMAKASEARHYLYDSQQRHVDRVLAGRRHSDVLEAQDQDKDWLQKLHSARDKCHNSILPAIQRSLLFVAVCFFAFHLYKLKNTWLYWDGSITNFVLVLFHKYMIPALCVATPDETDLDSGAYPARSFVGGWFWSAYPVLLLLPRVWSLVLVPLIGLVLLVAANFFLPSMLMQLAKTGLVIGLLTWAMSSIPWQKIFIGQSVFCVGAHIWAHVTYDRVHRALSRPGRSCPSNKESVHHLSVFDDTARFMTLYACLINFAIILHEVNRIGPDRCQNDPFCLP